MLASALLTAAAAPVAQGASTRRQPQQRHLVVCSSAAQPSRRAALQGAAVLLSGGLLARAAPALAFDDEHKMLVESAPTGEKVTTPSGLQYQDVAVGSGPSPLTGFQVVVNYVAMTPEGRVFDSSLDKGQAYQFRYGVGDVIPGLDEGLKTMRVGGVRRLYIPGELAFPKGVPAAAGRPRVAPSSPVVFDVALLLVPGLEDEE